MLRPWKKNDIRAQHGHWYRDMWPWTSDYWKDGGGFPVPQLRSLIFFLIKLNRVGENKTNLTSCLYKDFPLGNTMVGDDISIDSFYQLGWVFLNKRRSHLLARSAVLSRQRQPNSVQEHEWLSYGKSQANNFVANPMAHQIAWPVQTYQECSLRVTGVLFTTHLKVRHVCTQELL